MLYPSSAYLSLPSSSGIYFFLSGKGKILYVGKAKNLKRRVASYFTNKLLLGPKTQILVSQVKKIKTILTNSEIESLLLEADYIKRHKPKYNVKLTDGKAYPLIKITISEKYPKVLVARRIADNNSIYFGPFPSASAMRLVLKLARKIFPFQSSYYHPKKICFYHYLGLCPCPTVFDTKEVEKEYQKNIKHLLQFLQGNSKKLIRELKKERAALSRAEKFEKANFLQNKINAIELITSPTHKTQSYQNVNPNLTDDLRKKEINDLISILNANNVSVKNLKRVECYDISNIFGTNATGSMVVFSNGEKDGKEYRRFKIKTLPPRPNDFAMLKEVLQRRIKHLEWPLPNLLIVDGGKGQVSSALKVLKQKSINVPLIGLAKREEIIITSAFKEIALPKNSEALKLVMRIRDEAHRFAVVYHRSLRKKHLLSSNVVSVGEI